MIFVRAMLRSIYRLLYQDWNTDIESSCVALCFDDINRSLDSIMTKILVGVDEIACRSTSVLSRKWARRFSKYIFLIGVYS